MPHSELAYTIRESRRAASVSITITAEGEVRVTKPAGIPLGIVERFVQGKAAWIEKTLARFQKAQQRRARAGREIIGMPKLRRGTAAHREAAAAARRLVMERLPVVNQAYGFRHGRVSIRSQRTRWGSCSRRGTLSFNYRLVYLPLPLADYVIAHELCHLRHMNHSKAFWALVETVVPDWKRRRGELLRYRF
jgi:predicted metal-dependent hydrolase